MVKQEYKYGFVTDVETESTPPGLNEDIIRLISRKKNEPEWLLDWRLKAFRHWLTMTEPTWQIVHYPKIDYQDIIYYAAPKPQEDARKVWTKLIRNFWRLTRSSAFRCANTNASPAWPWTRCLIPFPSARRSRSSSRKKGIIFCSFSEAVQEHPDLVEKYLGTVVPYTDNFFAALNSAVFTDGSFCYIPKGVRCPMELSTYFRINAAKIRPVRAHAHHRRRRRVRELSRRLHRADAR